MTTTHTQQQLVEMQKIMEDDYGYEFKKATPEKVLRSYRNLISELTCMVSKAEMERLKAVLHS